MKIAGVTICYNEAEMVKYVMPYWERIGIDKLIVYDNMSTDNTVELLKQYPFVEVRPFHTDGKFDDSANSNIKKNVSLELANAGYDWIYHGDFDEVIYCENPNFREELKKIEDLGGTVFCRDLVHPFNADLTNDFDSTKLIHEQRSHFLTWNDWTNKWGGSKVLMHNAKKIHKISFTSGAHDAKLDFKGNVPVIFGYPFIAFHLKFVDLEVLEKNSHAKHERISWQLKLNNNRKIHKVYIENAYSRTMGDKLYKTINKLIKRTEKANTTSYGKFIDRYNSKYFIVNHNKSEKIPVVSRLDYDNIDLSIFYKG